MMGLGLPEIVVILVIILIIFGPRKLPDIGQALGKSIREFKKATSEPMEIARDVTKEVREVKEVVQK
ncbi:MAG: twin-arginine translocase TatA/TatE family subunit [Firmicutes bacterium HGW-Firmicutes-14]|jgi:sec-independent protein translocase protein TatA|nr:MAG: twin-arginine translocase TatA/TatE family subunit [Firmicutes bacterium HGW-Firmicutes-14]